MIRRQAETIIDNDVIANNCQIERIRNNSMIRQLIEAIIDNNVIENILARQEQVNILIPSPISPIPNTTIGSESEKEEEENTEEDDKEASEEGEEQENTTIPQAASKSPGSSTTTDTTISSSSDSMHSAQNSSLSFQVDFPNDREKHDNQSNLDNKQQPMQIHNNDINFLEEINNLNRARGGKIKTVISSIRPSFQAISNNDYFMCHICHLYPKIITTWEDRTNPYPWQKGINEHPFARNIGAIIRHLIDNHYKLEGARHVTVKVEHLLTSIKKDMEESKKHPTYFKPVSIPKSSSTSCLQAAWKSNQTDLTKEMVNTYTFDKDNCVGHVKIIPTQGLEYEIRSTAPAKQEPLIMTIRSTTRDPCSSLIKIYQ
jgi:ribosomal protein L12E/L44/L45/RPP1/RPP2